MRRCHTKLCVSFRFSTVHFTDPTVEHCKLKVGPTILNVFICKLSSIVYPQFLGILKWHARYSVSLQNRVNRRKLNSKTVRCGRYIGEVLVNSVPIFFYKGVPLCTV